MKWIILITVWLIFIVSDYFLLPYFVKPFVWLLLCLILLILSIIQIIKIIKDRKNVRLARILTFSIIIIVLSVTFYGFNKIPHSIMEKIDWKISYEKRKQIVNDVEGGKLKPNTEMNNGICELPFEFPIISNGGNDIWIHENKNGQTKTIQFWISRGFFESPQIYFVYTNDDETKRLYNKLIDSKPQYNWKIEENWYRITERL